MRTTAYTLLTCILILILAVAANAAPIPGSIANQAVNEGATLSFNVSASAPDNGNTTFSFSSDAQAEQFIQITKLNNTLATLAIAPGYDDAASYEVNVTAQDLNSSNKTTFTLIVNEVESPVLDTIANVVMNEAETLTTDINHTPAENNNFSITAAFVPEGPGFASVSQISSTQSRITLTPGFSDAGTYTLQVNVSDNDSLDTETFMVQVNNVNRQPVVQNIGNVTVLNNTPAALNLSTIVSDPDGDAVNFAVSSVNTSQLSCSITTQGGSTLLNYSPATNYLGPAECVLSTSDFEGNVTQTSFFFNVQVPSKGLSISTVELPAAFNNVSVNTMFTVTNTGNIAIKDIVLSQNAPASTNAALSPTNIAQLNPGESQVITLELFYSSEIDTSRISIGRVTVSGTETLDDTTIQTTRDIFANARSRLQVSDLDVRVGGTTDSDVPIGSTVSEEIELGRDTTLEINLELENLYPSGSNIDIEDVKVDVEIRDIDDGRDLDDDLERDIDAGDEEVFDFRFDVPLSAEEGTYEVFFDIEGDDELGIEHRLSFSIFLRVDRDTHDIFINTFNVNPTTVICGNPVTVGLEAVNIGTKDEEEVRFTIKQNDLDFDFEDEIAELESDPDSADYATSEQLFIPMDTESGNYVFEARAFYDESTLSDLKRFSLKVECDGNDVVQQPVSNPDPQPQEDDENDDGNENDAENENNENNENSDEDDEQQEPSNPSVIENEGTTVFLPQQPAPGIVLPSSIEQNTFPSQNADLGLDNFTILLLVLDVLLLLTVIIVVIMLMGGKRN